MNKLIIIGVILSILLFSVILANTILYATNCHVITGGMFAGRTVCYFGVIKVQAGNVTETELRV
jgi:hypothetical protein